MVRYVSVDTWGHPQREQKITSCPLIFVSKIQIQLRSYEMNLYRDVTTYEYVTKTGADRGCGSTIKLANATRPVIDIPAARSSVMLR